MTTSEEEPSELTNDFAMKNVMKMMVLPNQMTQEYCCHQDTGHKEEAKEHRESNVTMQQFLAVILASTSRVSAPTSSESRLNDNVETNKDRKDL